MNDQNMVCVPVTLSLCVDAKVALGCLFSYSHGNHSLTNVSAETLQEVGFSAFFKFFFSLTKLDIYV